MIRAALATLCVFLALPVRPDGPPLPPPGQGHYVVAPGAPIRLATGEVKTAAPDNKDPSFGGLYVPPDWARYDRDLRRYYEEYAKQCAEEAADNRAKGLVVGVVGGFAISASILGVVWLVRR